MTDPTHSEPTHDTSSEISAKALEEGQEKTSLPDLYHGCGPPPDGGFRAWLVAAGAFAAFFACLGFSNSFGVMAEYYLEHQLRERSADDIAWIGSLATFLQFFSGMLGGPLFDRFGTKVTRPAAVLYVFGMMMLSLCKTYYQFILCQGVLMGVTMGFIQIPAIAVISQYFDRNRAAAMGCAISGSSVGGIVVPIVLSKMLNGTTLGFGWTVRIIGFVIIPIMAFAVTVIRPRLPPRPTDTWTTTITTALAHNRGLLGLTVSMFFIFMGMFFPFFFLPTYAVTRGMGATLAGDLSAILNAASTFGRIIPGVLADRWGRMNTYAVGSISTAVVIFCFAAPTTNAGLIVYALAFGFTSGTIISGVSVAFSVCCEDPRDMGTYAGVGMAIAALGGLIGPPLDGVFKDHYGGFSEASMFSGAVCLLGGVIAFLTKATTKKGLFGNI